MGPRVGRRTECGGLSWGSGELGLAGDGGGRGFHGAELVLLGAEALGAFEGLVPGQGLTGVGGHAGDDGEHGAVGAALGVLGPDARLTVAELVPEIINWARGPMAALTAGCLDDPRVRLVAGDVAAEIASASKRYDAILLDVDNGPSGLVRADNDGLYSMRGLALAKAALKPGGILAIWSAAPDAAFTRRLKDAGFKVDEVIVRARSNGKGPRHTIWFAEWRP